MIPGHCHRPPHTRLALRPHSCKVPFFFLGCPLPVVLCLTDVLISLYPVCGTGWIVFGHFPLCFVTLSKPRSLFDHHVPPSVFSFVTLTLELLPFLPMVGLVSMCPRKLRSVMYVSSYFLLTHKSPPSPLNGPGFSPAITFPRLPIHDTNASAEVHPPFGLRRALSFLFFFHTESFPRKTFLLCDRISFFLRSSFCFPFLVFHRMRCCLLIRFAHFFKFTFSPLPP